MGGMKTLKKGFGPDSVLIFRLLAAYERTKYTFRDITPGFDFGLIKVILQTLA